MRAFRQNGAGRVGTDMAGDAGQHVDARADIDGQPQFAGPCMDLARDGEREGRLAELCRIDAEEEVMHDRVADKDGVEDGIGFHLALAAGLGDEVVDGAANGLRHGLAAFRLHHDIGDAAHQILAEADLRVLGADGGRHTPRKQGDEVHRDGGGTDVAGDAVGLVLQSRPERDDGGARGIEIAVDGGGDAPIALAQDRLDLRQEMLGDEQIFPAPFGLQPDLEPVEIAERLVHVGLVDLDITELDGGVALDDALDRRFAHDLGVDLDVLGHVDDEIALDGGRAGEPAAGRQLALSA